MKLHYITNEGVANLKNNFKSNLQYYQLQDNAYFLNYLKDRNYLLESPYECEEFTSKLVFSRDTRNADFENIKIVYSAMKNIPTSIAFDERLWVCITHTIMWDYVKKRRKEEAFADNLKNRDDKIYNSFFTYTKHGKKRGTFINCVSRLWWTGFLSYDKDNKNDPYELTKLICEPGTILPLSSSNIISRKETILALLSVTKKKREEGFDIKRDDMIKAVKYLNLVAGITLLDLLDREEIELMVETYYNKNCKRLLKAVGC